MKDRDSDYVMVIPVTLRRVSAEEVDKFLNDESCPRSMSSSAKYREGWDRVFKKDNFIQSPNNECN